jgi:hypothetical protein
VSADTLEQAYIIASRLKALRYAVTIIGDAMTFLDVVRKDRLHAALKSLYDEIEATEAEWEKLRGE